jgi:hypothetical protein
LQGPPVVGEEIELAQSLFEGAQLGVGPLIPELIADGGSVVAFVWAVRNPYLNLKTLAASFSRGPEFVPWRNAACQA